MTGDDSRGGASNCKSHYSEGQHSNSHAKGHHSKSHHDKSSRPETGTRATEDLYGMESGANKKKKRCHHRPKPKPRLPTDFLALLCWDSWLPWPIDSKKTQIDKASRKHKRSRKRTSHSGTSHRVQSWHHQPPFTFSFVILAEAAEAASNNGRTKKQLSTSALNPTQCSSTWQEFWCGLKDNSSHN
ncbi:uncharacterized protein FRV6_01830 [Fusarium oxysporum]|uniref:Uncharacterized protein n=1 Tax=Fusarium oxysporum TaxID=5507 RepID=A0A2H3SM99_FUSOX|nr:uncharacterized protein FRV6_01830 [Fusarium oxysporum]